MPSRQTSENLEGIFVLCGYRDSHITHTHRGSVTSSPRRTRLRVQTFHAASSVLAYFYGYCTTASHHIAWKQFHRAGLLFRARLLYPCEILCTNMW
jgi:hypothetical protein